MRIKGSLGLTIPTGVQFQMIRVDVGMEKDVDDAKVSLEKHYSKMFTEIEEELNHRVDRMIKGFGRKLT